ncbi:uncharacterized protein LOC100553595 [Anolis carolinensis]|uniref:uncharacterized protein LOC100553595 n=1 Tax=Anolis carolinensis TaxID=28377 RepID=UPI000462CDD9|nr:PREDICTED: uncharacterized protein LOC100553595 [Anolis carolinensis]|eukprot:XP_008117420.1 PREDICTED: uncharacterized protein LOC100553595 [Anolis carolinensis]
MGIGEETRLGEVQTMDRGLCCSLLLLLALKAAAPKRGNGSGPIWGSSWGATVGPLGSPPPLFDCSLQGVGDWPLSPTSMEMVANRSQNEQEGHVGDFRIWVILPIFLLLAFIFILTCCCECLLKRMIAAFERNWRSNNLPLRVFNQSSSNGYGAFENIERQAPDIEGSQDSAASVDDGIIWMRIPPRERGDSEVTLEADKVA